MLADFFTKPLQGALFRKFRKLILNLPDMMTSPQECVGTSGDEDRTRDSTQDVTETSEVDDAPDLNTEASSHRRTYSEVASGKRSKQQ
jgi:hypothetical protein